MQGVSTANEKSLINVILDALETPAPVLLTGPHGSGKTHALRSLSSVLGERGIAHQYIDATSSNAATQLASMPPHAVILIDDYALAPLDVLRTMANQLVSGAKMVGAASESARGSSYSEHLGELYSEIPELQTILNSARILRLELHSTDEIARLAHRHSDALIDSTMLAAIQQLSWGRPGWALDALQLQRIGSLATTPRPRITHVRAEDLHLPSLRNAAGIAAAHLDADDVAAAAVLAEIGPRSWNSVADVFGAEEATRLADADFLLPLPHADDLYGVPKLYAAATQRLTTPEKLAATRRTAAEHLLSQELFGIPLPDQEASFCAQVLSSRDRDPAASPAIDPQHTPFIKRVIGDLVSFGEGTQARDLLLRLGPQGPGLSQLERARLTTVLRDAHTGLQAIMTAQPPRANFDLPTLDPDTRFALLMIRGRLAAETGIPLEGCPDIAADDEIWRDAQLVVRRWNDTEPVGTDIRPLLRIAQTHPMPEVALLAEQLLSFEAGFFGLRYRAFTESPVEQRIAQLAVGSADISRDTLESVAVARSLTRLFAAVTPPDSQHRSNVIDLLPGASRHRIWSAHLHASHTATFCGNAARSYHEWLQFADTIPRFLPWRLQSVITESLRLSADGSPPAAVTGHLGLLFAYCTGHTSGSVSTRLADPYGDFARYSGGHIDIAELEEAPDRPVIRRHLDALHEQNPLALTRVGDELAAHELWAPALHAFGEARRIYLRRRATGSVTNTDERIQELEAKVSERVPWFDPEALHATRRERLTPRETTAAQLAATGLSNREIAEQMRCSVRTVESHIAQARAKLGLSSRKELKTHFSDGSAS